jgi:hypothetical protein
MMTKNIGCLICGDAATETCQYCGKPLCALCKKLEKECLNYRITQKKAKQ